jgi:transposase
MNNDIIRRTVIRRCIGLDIHEKVIFVTVLSPLEGTARQWEISTDRKAFRGFLETLQPGDEVALEATRGSRYYVDLLLTRVHSVLLANPQKLRTLSGKQAKNDRNDSLNLALLLAVGTLPTVWIPSEETRQDREILRHRANLVKERTRIKNRVRALLAENGLRWEGSDVQSTGARRFLSQLLTQLPWATREVLTSMLEQFDQLEVHLGRIEAVALDRAARRPEVAVLMTIRGIDVLNAFTIVSEIDAIERFASPDSLANYAGLVPSQRSSAGKDRFGRVIKGGAKMLRWALTEAVQQLAKQDGPYRNMARRIQNRKKNKGVAMAAVARKLLVAIWHMLTKKEAFRYAEPDLVERKAQRREQRLVVARARLEAEKDRHQQIITGRLALVQELAEHRVHIPVPEPLLTTFGRRPKRVAS